MSILFSIKILFSRKKSRAKYLRFWGTKSPDFYEVFTKFWGKYEVFTKHFCTVLYSIVQYWNNKKPRHNGIFALQRGFLVGGVREIWTLAAVSHPTPLAGAPLRPLEYYSTVKVICLFTCYQKWRRGWDSNPWSARANRWFSRPVHKPLGHLSTVAAAKYVW